MPITTVAQITEHGARLNQKIVGNARLADGFFDFSGFGIEGRAQRRDLRFGRFSFAVEFAHSAGDFLLTRKRFSALARLLGDARGAGQHAGESGINVSQVRAVVGQGEFADLVGMRRAARFKNV